MDEPLRLAKRVAAQQGCSRQQAELLIVGGWVRVDGQTIEQPQARVRPEQAVLVDPKARPEPAAPVTLLWHKPAGVVLPDEPNLPDDVAQRWFAAAQRHVGERSGNRPAIRPLQVHRHRLLMPAPLDAMASGLMAFTQNPGVARKLADRQSPLEQEWLVDVPRGETGAAGVDDGDAAERDAVLRSLGKPLYFQGSELPRARAAWQSDTRLRLVIKGPIAGQVPHLLERAGLRATALRRQRMGQVGIGSLPVGGWTYLDESTRF